MWSAAAQHKLEAPQVATSDTDGQNRRNIYRCEREHKKNPSIKTLPPDLPAQIPGGKSKLETL